jgi:hypothetical protein
MVEATIEQHVMAAISAAIQVYRDPEFENWARGWLSGLDRTFDSAEAARRRAEAAFGDDREDAADRAWRTQLELLEEGVDEESAQDVADMEFESSLTPAIAVDPEAAAKRCTGDAAMWAARAACFAASDSGRIRKMAVASAETACALAAQAALKKG